MQLIAPFLWFDNQAEEAANFYVSIFPDSCITNIARYPEGSPAPAGSVMVVNFQLNGQDFNALNGGPIFKFTEAISFVVNCDTQQEIDRYWAKLIEGGGKEGQCGWLKDKFGLSWQIVPTTIGKLMSGKDPERSARVMAEVMKMVKPDIARMHAAYDGK